ncbi:hypothetical protein LOAG_10934 [Loa loa]|uniref:Uncharacterized protein n=1 Tax=Loa loa TaxID=7209 RepID=A0A1S0TPF8_LOALO|nr:hypothetical protein LOAG_10934 [Loa loa]EFO17564.1 hypothetical protein LOAG_10934 [Loa loa]
MDRGKSAFKEMGTIDDIVISSNFKRKLDKKERKLRVKDNRGIDRLLRNDRLFHSPLKHNHCEPVENGLKSEATELTVETSSHFTPYALFMQYRSNHQKFADKSGIKVDKKRELKN